jgi:hypothetical protein
MAKKKLNIGMIGYGFMGRAHSNAFRKVNNFFDLEYQPVLKAACARNAEKAQTFADNWGYESIETDWRKLVERDDIDCIDIGSPNNTHEEIVLAAAAKGKMILCEKPLAMNAEEGERMTAAVEKAGVPNMVWYNYRRVPAITLAKQLIDEGRLGRIFRKVNNFFDLEYQPVLKAASGASSTTARSTSRTGPSAPNCPRAARASGASTPPSPVAASPATSSPTPSTLPSGSPAASKKSPPSPRLSSKSASTTSPDRSRKSPSTTPAPSWPSSTTAP